MEPFSALLDLCAGNSPVTGEFPSQKPVTRIFDVFFDLRLNKRLSKQSRRRWIALMIIKSSMMNIDQLLSFLFCWSQNYLTMYFLSIKCESKVPFYHSILVQHSKQIGVCFVMRISKSFFTKQCSDLCIKDVIDDKSKLVWETAWRHQTSGHSLNQVGHGL